MIQRCVCLLWLAIPHFLQAQVWRSDSIPLAFRAELADGAVLVAKHRDRFYLCDLVANRVWVANQQGRAVAQTSLNHAKAQNRQMVKAMAVADGGVYLNYGSGSFYRLGPNLDSLPPDHFPLRRQTPGSIHHVIVEFTPFLVLEKPAGNTYLLPVLTLPSEVPAGQHHFKYWQPSHYARLSKSEPFKLLFPRDPVFREKMPLYDLGQFAVWGQAGQVLVGDAASPTIRIHDLAGRELATFGERGRALTARDTIPWVPYPPLTLDTLAANRLNKQMQKMDGAQYGPLFYDPSQDLLYRFYLASRFAHITGPYHMQVYKGQRLIADLAFPAERYRVFAASEGALWAVPKDPDDAAPASIHWFRLEKP